jgi:excisionase family DNA binding protein
MVLKRDIEKPVWLSVEDALYATGIGRTKLYELLGKGTLKSISVGRKRLISLASIEALSGEGI